MKAIVIVVGALACSMSVLASSRYQQASRFVPHLIPHVAEHQASHKTLVTRNENGEKNFTHNQLFTLQKKFLDNFIAPNNAIQVRSPAPELRSIFQIHKY